MVFLSENNSIMNKSVEDYKNEAKQLAICAYLFIYYCILHISLYIHIYDLCSFLQVFEDIYLSSKPQLMKALDILNIIFCVIFFIEFVLKIVGLGAFGYFKNPWNCLDFMIVVVWINIFISSQQASVMQVLVLVS